MKFYVNVSNYNNYGSYKNRIESLIKNQLFLINCTKINCITYIIHTHIYVYNIK